jgi:hypothetical protein
VWAAGVKAPEVLKRLDELEVNRINQLLSNRHRRRRARFVHQARCRRVLMSNAELPPKPNIQQALSSSESGASEP